MSKIIKENQASSASGAHGGDIITASARYNIPQQQWLDLSTGLNASSYPTHNIPSTAFRQLPYLQPEFLRATAQYYGSEQFIPLIGSQMLIASLPGMLDKKPVLVPDVGYSEHRDSWVAAGFQINDYLALTATAMLQSVDAALLANRAQHLVVINPNNPSGVLIAPEQLLTWAAQLDTGCYLIVDEAFIDLTPQLSVLAHQWPANMLVLRSFGKFFGLAGIRIGFAFAQGDLRAKIEKKLGLWMINGPAQFLASQAFLDSAWQERARVQIAADAQLSAQLFAPLIEFLQTDKMRVTTQVHSGLFSSYKMPLSCALSLQQQFCQAGILLRVIALKPVGEEMPALLRVGILSTENTEQQRRVSDCVMQIIGAG